MGMVDRLTNLVFSKNRAVMIVARTLKGKGISFLENADSWHGKALDQEREQQALGELSDVDREVRGTITAGWERSDAASRNASRICGRS